MKKVIKSIFLIGAIGLLVYLGACSFLFFRERQTANAPTPDTASVQLIIRNTGTIILTNHMTQTAAPIGQRRFTIEGFWDMPGSNWQYHKGKLVLDEAVQGTIDVRQQK